MENYFRLLNFLLIKNYNYILHVEKPIIGRPKIAEPISGQVVQSKKGTV